MHLWTQLQEVSKGKGGGQTQWRWRTPPNFSQGIKKVLLMFLEKKKKELLLMVGRLFRIIFKDCLCTQQLTQQFAVWLVTLFQDACTTLKQRLEPLQAQHPDYSWEQLVGPLPMSMGSNTQTPPCALILML